MPTATCSCKKKGITSERKLGHSADAVAENNSYQPSCETRGLPYAIRILVFSTLETFFVRILFVFCVSPSSSKEQPMALKLGKMMTNWVRRKRGLPALSEEELEQQRCK